MKKIFLPFLVVIVAFTSCQKEIQWNPDDSNNPDTTDSTSTYQPMTANSKWTYRVHQTFKIDSTMFNGIDLSQLGLSINDLLAMMGQTQTVTDTTYQYDVVCTGRDTTIDAKSYKIFISTQEIPHDAYMRKDNNDYYQRGALISMGTDDFANGDIQMLYLKSNQPVGYSWTEQLNLNIGGNVAQDEIKYTIKSKGATKEVNGKIYKDVIQVEMKITPKVENMPEIPGMSLDFSTTTELFFAKDIGFIYEEIKPMMGTSMTVELISEDIK